MKKTIIKSFGLLIGILVFYFLIKNLIVNWEEVKQYKFSINYFYMLISFLFFVSGNFLKGIVWKKIIDFLEKDNDLGYGEAIDISTISQLGRYIPGKIFSLLGKAYLCKNKKISRLNLYTSITLDAILPIFSAFILSFVLIAFYFPVKFPYYFLLIVVFIVILVNPCIIKLVGRKINLLNLPNWNWGYSIKIVLGYMVSHFLIGVGFFLLIKSILSFSFQNLLSIIGVYTLAGVIGLIVIFIPGGLGIREGILVLFLNLYFPFNVSILISIIGRIWTIIGDILTVIIVILFRLCKIYLNRSAFNG